MRSLILKKCAIQSCNASAYLGSSWKNNSDQHALFSYNPSTGEALAAIAPCSTEDYTKVIQGLLVAHEQWRCTPAPARGELIRKIGLRLRDSKEEIAALISLEMGKIYQEALGEVQEMIDMTDFCVGQSRMLYGKTMHSERAMHRMYEQWHPLGIVGVITAFNFPVAVWAWNAFLNAICGNVTLWKPSSKTPLSAIAIYEICIRVLKENHAPDIFGLLITDDRALSGMLLDDVRVPLISFTGSTAVGKYVATRVANRLGQTILELGGNNAMIVDESANLKLAIPAIVFSAIGTAGQRCTSTRRLIVHEEKMTAVISCLQQAYATLKIGDPLDQQCHMGPLIDKNAVNKFDDVIKESTHLGAKINIGGACLSKPGYFVSPTLISGVRHDASLVFEENFVPILFIFSYRTFDEALHIHNEVPQGLSSSLFTERLQHAERFLSTVGSDCGIANINIGTTGAEIGGAFGGEKNTGRGREAGSDAWKSYMRRQTVTINWGDTLPLSQGIMFNTSS
jgi:aldehyde dehydrogenase (NAD+)